MKSEEAPIYGPTYLTLVRHFWVRAQLYDQKAAQLELEEKVLIDPSLKGKTHEEMGLEPFRGDEIRSSVLGIPVAISVNTIAGVIRRASGGKYIFWLERQEKLLDTHCKPNLVQQFYQRKVQGYG